jgi:hypothetical protein
MAAHRSGRGQLHLLGRRQRLAAALPAETALPQAGAEAEVGIEAEHPFVEAHHRCAVTRCRGLARTEHG